MLVGNDNSIHLYKAGFTVSKLQQGIITKFIISHKCKVVKYNYNNCDDFVHLHKEGVIVLYIVNNLTERIKIQADKKHKSVAEVLRKCGLSENTVSTMTSRGSWIKSNSLGMIADELGCSVDYLLCRTENPDSHNTHASDIAVSPYEDRQLASIIKIYEQLDDVGKAKLLIAADELRKHEGK